MLSFKWLFFFLHILSSVVGLIERFFLQLVTVIEVVCMCVSV